MFFLFFSLTQGHFLLLLRRKGKRQRQTRRQTDRRWLVLVASSTYPDWGLDLQPGGVPWLGIKPAAFWSVGGCSDQLSPQAWAFLSDYCSSHLIFCISLVHSSHFRPVCHRNFYSVQYLFSLRLSFPLGFSHTKVTTANTTIAIQCEWIKIPIFLSDWQKTYFMVCHRIRVVVYVCREMRKAESQWSVHMAVCGLVDLVLCVTFVVCQNSWC